ncbi:MAG: hypothetical protein HQL69_21350 [Magnetococcales bacterium]|nr:hypothetical protein [Magnetococcales bacterium]
MLAFTLLIIVGSPSVAKENASQISQSSAVTFNVLCAKCHEGQCSGRLSFSGGVSDAQNHIQRYAGKMDGETVSQLHNLLAYMKERCGYHSAIGRAPTNLRWDEKDLFSFSVPEKRGYFIPLGRLDAGSKYLHGVLVPPGPVRLEVISDTFEFVAEECVYPSEDRFELTFENLIAGKYFLRVTGNPPPLLRGMELEVVE